MNEQPNRPRVLVFPYSWSGVGVYTLTGVAALLR